MKDTTKTNRNLALVIILPITIIIIVIIGLVLFITRQNHLATLDILVAPASSDIIIDGKTYHHGAHKLEPGIYHIEVKKPDFTTKTFTVTLSSGKTTDLHTYLLQSDGSFSWYLDHQDDSILLTQIGDEEANKLMSESEQKYPILSDLPIIIDQYDAQYNYTNYRIDGGNLESCTHDFCLIITDTTGGNEEKAKNEIKNRGYSLDDYEIIYHYEPIAPLE